MLGFEGLYVMMCLILWSSFLVLVSNSCSLVTSCIFLTAHSKMYSGYFLDLSFLMMVLASEIKWSCSVQILLALTSNP